MWVRAGSGDSIRNIPIHFIGSHLGKDKCSTLPALHHLTGADYTSKVGTKASALNVGPENYLLKFGSSEYWTIFQKSM